MLDHVLGDFNETTEQPIQPIQLKTPDKIKTNKAQTCTHENKVKDKVNYICTDCGQEVEPEVNKSFDKFIPKAKNSPANTKSSA